MLYLEKSLKYALYMLINVIIILCRQGFELNFVLFNFNTFSFILNLQNNFSHSTLFYRVERCVHYLMIMMTFI